MSENEVVINDLIIKQGDMVILWAGRERLYALTIKQGGIFNNKFGEFHHNDIIGQSFGSKILARRRGQRNGFVFVLKPTPELWTAGAISHRTQIIYSLDISMIIFHLELKPGSIVVESGTGSGSLSRAFARTIAPHGQLYTFEFHEQRANSAKQDFEQENLSKIITVTHCDACRDGFGLHNIADAVFLDLPSPWAAIASATESLKEGGKLCIFTPSVEQVQQVTKLMRELNYSEMKTIECRLRPFLVTSIDVDTYNFDNLSSLSSSSSSSSSDSQTSSFNEQCLKRKRQDKENERQENESIKENEKQEKENIKEELLNEKEEHSIKSKKNFHIPTTKTQMLVTQPVSTIRGHTSFLTFARK